MCALELFYLGLKSSAAYHLMTMELDADTDSDKWLPRDMAVSQPSDTEDILQEEAETQGKEKGSPVVNLSLTIVMSCACYSPLSIFISFSSFCSHLYWCLPLEFHSIRSMGVDVRAYINVVKKCLSFFGGPKKQMVNILGHTGSSAS